ncbi:hypothetical protein D3C86_2138280 [compost metagenome]
MEQFGASSLYGFLAACAAVLALVLAVGQGRAGASHSLHADGKGVPVANCSK